MLSTVVSIVVYVFRLICKAIFEHLLILDGFHYKKFPMSEIMCNFAPKYVETQNRDIMKKLFLFAIAVLCLASCGDDANVTGGGDDVKPTNPTEATSSTKVYVQGEDLSGTYTTRALAAQSETAHFFLRIDNRIPDKDGNYSYPSNLYWPKKAGNTGDVTVIADGNAGTIDMNYPYWTISGDTRYVFDTSGMAVQNALLKVPTWSDLMAANQDHSYGIENIDFSKYKIIWYVIKKEKNGWHVDGVLTLLSTKDATEVPGITITESGKLENQKKDEPAASLDNGNVEVDIHQQIHKDWNEIKTSIHVRDLVDDVKVEIPIERDNMVPSDDFAIRTYDYNLDKVYIKGTEWDLGTGNPIKVSVEHQADKIVITISAINHEYVKKLLEAYGDGITVEVHSYPKNLANDAIWKKMYDVEAKKSKCSVTVSPSSYDTSKVKLHTTKYAATEETTEE